LLGAILVQRRIIVIEKALIVTAKEGGWINGITLWHVLLVKKLIVIK
jgi:hypothetical protein